MRLYYLPPVFCTCIQLRSLDFTQRCLQKYYLQGKPMWVNIFVYTDSILKQIILGLRGLNYNEYLLTFTGIWITVKLTVFP